MDRIWQWIWNRYGTRYSWACYAVTLPVLLPIYLVLSFVVVAFEHSGRYVEATAVTAIAIPVMVYAMLLPGRGSIRIAENWVAGLNIERASALNATYTWARRMVAPAVAANAIIAALLAIVVGTIAGASGSRSVQYGIVGAVFGTLVCVIAVHSFVEAALRPVRVAIAGDTDMGDSL